ncbi:MAG: T9SS type A sorting domain-containing protein [Bacteroidota bacterium]
MKKLIIFTLLLFFGYTSNSQPIPIYGGYVRNHCIDCFNYGLGYYHSYKAVVFFNSKDIIPDSIIFRAGIKYPESSSAPTKYAKTAQVNLCNGITKVIYETGIWSGTPSTVAATAKFETGEVKYTGKNMPDSIDPAYRLLVTTYGKGRNENNSSYSKDIPLVTIEKGKSNTINLFGKDDDNDSLIFSQILPNESIMFTGQVANLFGMKLNTKTGDMFIPNTLDTGYYSLQVRVMDYFKTDSFGDIAFQSFTLFDFTLYVTNQKIPYFIHSKNAKKDTMGINYLSTLPNDKTISYQLDYINPKGLGNYSVAIPSVKQFKIPQTYTATKINDTTLRINITINLTGTYYLDTFWYRKVRELPNSITVIITTTDSLGNCKQDLTSFYVTNNTSSSTNELTDINRITIFPNPATNKINMVFEGNVPQNLIANIYDSKGSLVKTETLINNEIDINNLAQGLYLLTIVSEGKRYSSKFIKE